MKTSDFHACVFNEKIYCNMHLPDGVDMNSDGVHPIFADSEWDYYPVCCHCGGVHDYLSLTGKGE